MIGAIIGDLAAWTYEMIKIRFGSNSFQKIVRRLSCRCMVMPTSELQAEMFFMSLSRM